MKYKKGNLMNPHIQNFLNYLEVERNCSPNTIRDFGCDLKQFERFKPSVEGATISVIREFLSTLNGKSPATKARKIATLKSFYRFLVNEKVISESPAERIIPPKIPERLPSYLVPADLRKILNTPQKFYKVRRIMKRSSLYLRDKACLGLLIDTGIRIGELVNLNKDDIDIENWTVKIKNSKNNTEQELEFSEDTKKVLEQYLFSIRHYRSPVLFMGRNQKRVNIQTIRIRIIKLGEMAGIKKHITPHIFRHTLGTDLVKKDVNLAVIKDLLRHKSIQSTMIYTRLLPEDKKKIQREFLKKRFRKKRR